MGCRDRVINRLLTRLDRVINRLIIRLDRVINRLLIRSWCVTFGVIG